MTQTFEVRRAGHCFEVIVGDITTLALDGIVNAANPTLLGGGGVDGAIHRAAGPELLDACRRLDGCPTGEARITSGYRLPSLHVVHTVGPIWHGGGAGEDAQLAAAYRNSLELAAAHGLRSIAFPAISTGVYGFPADRAARIATAETWRTALRLPIERVVFCCFSANSAELHATALEEIAKASPP